MSLLVGVDFGTGGCKTTVIDKNGCVKATAFEEYPSEHLHPGWSEQNPEHWLQAMIHTVKRCMQTEGVHPQEVAGIGFSASTHNAVLLDEREQVIRPCIMWNDQRSAQQAARLSAEYGDRIFRIGMQMPTATWTMPQLLWIREDEFWNAPESRWTLRGGFLI